MNKSLVVILLAGLCAPSGAQATARVKIDSDQPSNAYLDGKLVGSTPLTLSSIKGGAHTVKVENLETGEVKIFHVYSPKNATTEKDIDVAWDTAAPPPPVAPTTETVRTVVVQPAQPIVQQVYGPPVQAYYPAPRRHYRSRNYGPYNDSYYQEERNKVRSRNVLLGAAAANEIFNRGSSQGTVRGVTLGGALLNEVLRSGR